MGTTPRTRHIARLLIFATAVIGMTAACTFEVSVADAIACIEVADRQVSFRVERCTS